MVEKANSILEEPIVCENGELKVPEGPGLGVTVNEEALEPFVALSAPFSQYRLFVETAVAQNAARVEAFAPPAHTLPTAPEYFSVRPQPIAASLRLVQG
mgnify:CR=1 FL=1